jgi:hypothetical protein
MGFSPFGGGFDFMFTVVPVFIGIIFVLVIGIVIFRMVKGGMEWNSNNHSPILTVNAKVTAKRVAVSNHHHHHSGDMSTHHDSSSTTYFATFEVESGDRMELKVPDKEYGMLAEGDLGKLTFQGTRYKGFERYRGGESNGK